MSGDRRSQWSALPCRTPWIPGPHPKERSFDPDCSNFERAVEEFLARAPYDGLLEALRAVNVNALESPISDLGL